MIDNPALARAVLFIRLSRPHFLLGGFLLFALGSAIAGYLGHPVDPGLYILGQAIVTSIQLGANYLNEYFDVKSDFLSRAGPPYSDGGEALEGVESLNRKVALYAAIASVTFGGTLVSILLTTQRADTESWIAIALAVAGAMAYSVPPARLISSGYGELVGAFVMAGLVPTFSFTLQTGEFHRLLVMSTVPLVALLFAALIVFDLPRYASNLKAGKGTLLVRLGWESGMRVHDASVVFAFLTLLMAFALGMPRRVALGSMIALPLGAAEIWMLWRIRQGDPPRWTLLTSAAVLLFGLATYLQLAGYLLS